MIPPVGSVLSPLETKASRAKDVSADASGIATPGSAWSALPQIALFRWLSPSGMRGRRVEAASFAVLFVAIGLCFADLASSDTSPDDNQILRFTGQSGPFLVAVFAQPGDLSPGHTSFGVLVQDRNTQEVQLDATVDLTVRSDADTPSPSSTAHAVPAKTENKLLQTAELSLPNEGDWRMYVSIERNSQAADFVLPLRVVRSPTALEQLYPWPYMALAALGVILLLVYFQRHREPASTHIRG